MPLHHCVPFQTREAEALGTDVKVRDKTVRSREQTELEKSCMSLALSLLVNMLIIHRSLPVLRDLVFER